MRNLVAFIVGIIFAIGLVISGMTNPDKVIGFLDIFGNWDYALAFVMGGAVLFNLISFKFILSKPTPILCDNFDVPSKTELEKRIYGGAILFGIGWGLLGMCPGPAIVNLALLDTKVIVFVLSMAIGMNLFKFINSKIN